MSKRIQLLTIFKLHCIIKLYTMKIKNLFICIYLLVFSNDLKSQVYPTGFVQSNVVSGLSNPTAVAFAPDGRAFICQQTGALRIVKNNLLLPSPAITLSVNSSGERGLLGLAFDPNFTNNGFLYLYYTATAPVHNRICRFTVVGDVIDPASEILLMALENLSATNHNGGGMAFGPDGKLYIAVGDNAVSSNSQSVNNRLGKILRINTDGTIPTDNPAAIDGLGATAGVNRAIWCAGLRNPYTLTFQPGTGILFVNDVGQNTWEEINDCTIAGKNFGWPNTEGNFTQASFPNFTLPVYAYSHGSASGQGFAITGGTFYNPPTSKYPSQYIGKYFFMDFSTNWIDMLTFSAPVVNQTKAGAKQKETNIWTRDPFASSISGSAVGLTTGTDGNLYYLSRSTGALVKIESTIALPVSITFFSAEQKNKQNIKLEWNTNSETNAQYFEIQRSANAKGWKILGKIDAFGNSNESKTYQFIDFEPENGVNYYRLRQVDLNGTFEYSKIVSEYFDKNLVKIFPNPAKNILEFEGKLLDSNVEIFNELGQNISKNVKFSENKVDISQIPKGKYFLKINEKSYPFIKN